MTRFAKFSLLAVSSCALLAACSVPNSLPRGYVYHQSEFKSPNPPESRRFTTEQRVTMGPEQADQFRQAVYSLAESLTIRAGLPPKPVFVITPEKMTPFYSNIDNDLRESLRHLGYTISDTPEGAYAMAYNANIPQKPEGAAAHDTSPNVHLVLYVLDSVGENARILTQEEGDFYIRGASRLNVPFAHFGGTFIPEPTGPGTFRE
jgi:hypothetical protein